MKNFEGIPMPESWSDITLKQFSEYNKAAVNFKDDLDKIDEQDEDAITKALIKEAQYNYKVIEILSSLPEETVYEIDIATANEYVSNLNFLREKYEPKEIKYFSFEGVNYNVPDSIPISTKFGQYIESLQSEMVTKYTEKNSVIYLAHQIAHIVDNGDDWSAKERDELAKKFEDLPASIGLDFSFFFVQEVSDLQSSLPKARNTSTGRENAIYKKNLSAFGWIKTLYELAEAQVFNQPDKSPIESVKHTNTGEVFQYLSYITAKSNYESEITDEKYKK